MTYIKQFLTPLLIGATCAILFVLAAHAEIGGTYPEIGCTARGDCYSMLCTVVTAQREHCVKVPTPRARPSYADGAARANDEAKANADLMRAMQGDSLIPCDTDSDCMAKNPGVDF